MKNKKRTVITNLPTRPPIMQTIFYGTVLHYFDAHPIVWGIYITFFVFAWVVLFLAMLDEVKVNLDDEDSIKAAKTPFAELLKSIFKQ
jgi:hypothetical protein